MLKHIGTPLRFHSGNLHHLAALALMAAAAVCAAQTPPQPTAESRYFARRNTFGVFVAYSGDSSHILLGQAENRMLQEIGVSYSRRLVLNHIVNWQYDGELLPVVLESDPMGMFVQTETKPVATTVTYDSGPLVSCAPLTTSYSFTDPVTGTVYSGTTTASCHGRRWVTGEGMSPAGFRWNFRPQGKVQPFLEGHGGYMYSAQAIPVDTAGAFNFTFDIGAGIELYRTRTRSIRAAYRYHHISNDNTADANPGIDNGLIQVTYCFGR